MRRLRRRAAITRAHHSANATQAPTRTTVMRVSCTRFARREHPDGFERMARCSPRSRGVCSGCEMYELLSAEPWTIETGPGAAVHGPLADKCVRWSIGFCDEGDPAIRAKEGRGPAARDVRVAVEAGACKPTLSRGTARVSIERRRDELS
jgi:hypothetical protein